MTYLIKELLLDDSTSPFGDWFTSLESSAAAKVQVAVARMEQGNLSNVQWFSGIGEYRIDWGRDFEFIWPRMVSESFCCWVVELKNASKKTLTRRFNIGKTTNAARQIKDE